MAKEEQEIVEKKKMSKLNKIIIGIIVLAFIAFIVFLSIHNAKVDGEKIDDKAPISELDAEKNKRFWWIFGAIVAVVILLIFTSKQNLADLLKPKEVEPDVAEELLIQRLIERTDVPYYFESNKHMLRNPRDINIRERRFHTYSSTGEKFMIIECDIQNARNVVYNGIHIFAVPLTRGKKAIETGWIYEYKDSTHRTAEFRRNTYRWSAPKEREDRMIQQFIEGKGDANVEDIEKIRRVVSPRPDGFADEYGRPYEQQQRPRRYGR